MKEEKDINGKSLKQWQREHPQYCHVLSGYQRPPGKWEPGELAPYGYWVHEGPKEELWVRILRKLLN